jgi:hypothetical protein
MNSSSSIRIISNSYKIHFGALNKTLFQPSNSNLFHTVTFFYLVTSTKFQWFTSNPPLSSFKKLIVLTPMSRELDSQDAAMNVLHIYEYYSDGALVETVWK